ncbi:hypothetical protein Emag_000028 [Eimeria magna]
MPVADGLRASIGVFSFAGSTAAPAATTTKAHCVLFSRASAVTRHLLHAAATLRCLLKPRKETVAVLSGLLVRKEEPPCVCRPSGYTRIVPFNSPILAVSFKLPGLPHQAAAVSCCLPPHSRCRRLLSPSTDASGCLTHSQLNAELETPPPSWVSLLTSSSNSSSSGSSSSRSLLVGTCI